MFKRFIFVVTIFYSMSSVCTPAKAMGDDSANCEFTSRSRGSLTVRFAASRNLTRNPLQLDIDNGTIKDAWGLEAPITLSQQGNAVTFAVGSKWASNEDYEVQAGQEIKIEFTASEDKCTLSNIRFGAKIIPSLESTNPVVWSIPEKIAQPQDEIPPTAFCFSPRLMGPVPVCPYIDITLNEVTMWSNKEHSMQPSLLPQIIKDSGVSELRLAFITSRQDRCEPTFAGYDVATGYGVKIFEAIQKKRIKLTIAIGGAENTYLEQTSKSPEELASAYRKIISTYHPYGLDFDIEKKFEGDHPQKLTEMMKAIQLVQVENKDLNISFTLPVLPTGLVEGNGLGVLESAAAHKLKFSTNIMAMDYGPAFSSKSMGQYAIEAAKATFLQLKNAYAKNKYGLTDSEVWSRLQITPMIGLNDTVPQNFDLGDAIQLRQFAEGVGLGKLCFWSLNRDHSGYGTTNINHSSTHPTTQQPNQSVDWEFTRQFLSRE